MHTHTHVQPSWWTRHPPTHTRAWVTQHQTWNSQVHHTDRHHCAAINALINAVTNVEINAERRSKTWQRDHRELLAAGDCRGSATYLRASLQKTAKALRSLLSAFSAAPPGSIGTVYVILTKPFLLFWGEMAAWRRGGIKRKRLFPVFPIICFRCISNSVPGVHITWSRNSYVWYVKSSREKKNSARTYCPSQKDTQSIPKKTFICSKITILYYLDRKMCCCVANIA